MTPFMFFLQMWSMVYSAFVWTGFGITHIAFAPAAWL